MNQMNSEGVGTFIGVLQMKDVIQIASVSNSAWAKSYYLSFFSF